MKIRPLDRLWLALLAATAITYAVGESGAGGSAWPVLVIFGLAGAKGYGIAMDFMQLRDAPPLWRQLVLAWLGTVLVLIGLAWWLARSGIAAAGAA